MFLDVVESCVLASVLVNHGVNILSLSRADSFGMGRNTCGRKDRVLTSSTLLRLLPCVVATFLFDRVSEQQLGMEPEHRFSTDTSVCLFEDPHSRDQKTNFLNCLGQVRRGVLPRCRASCVSVLNPMGAVLLCFAWSVNGPFL